MAREIPPDAEALRSTARLVRSAVKSRQRRRFVNSNFAPRGYGLVENVVFADSSLTDAPGRSARAAEAPPGWSPPAAERGPSDHKKVATPGFVLATQKGSPGAKSVP